MRVLVSLEGPTAGQTVRALGRIAHDAVHVLAVDPESEAVDRVRSLVERQGASFSLASVPEASFLAAFEAIREAIQAQRTQGPEVGVEVQINAGKDANLLSAAGLLACLHEGVPAHFVHEEGHTPLPVFTEAPLERLLGEKEREALVGFPGEGILLVEASKHDPGALNDLKDRGLIERVEDRLMLTRRGEAYQRHLVLGEDAGSSPST